MERLAVCNETKDLNFEATELRLGLPGIEEPDREGGSSQLSSTVRSNKRAFAEMAKESSGVSDAGNIGDDHHNTTEPPSKAQVVGWPPIRSYRKNCLAAKKSETENIMGIYVKVSMDGAPYLRKIDLNVYKSYAELVKALENMFKFSIGGYSQKEGFNGSDYAPTYEDKDGDWMLVGDVPWDMFASSCKRLRIMKGSEARGLGCL